MENALEQFASTNFHDPGRESDRDPAVVGMLHDQLTCLKRTALNGLTEFFSIGGGKFCRTQLIQIYLTQQRSFVAEKPLSRRVGIQNPACFGVCDQNGVSSRLEKGAVKSFVI
mgnify:FL=1